MKHSLTGCVLGYLFLELLVQYFVITWISCNYKSGLEGNARYLIGMSGIVKQMEAYITESRLRVVSIISKPRAN